MFKILVADDEEMIRRGLITMLTRELTSHELVFIEAENGIQAVERYNEELPDLVISDIRMPRCDGLELVRRLRSYQHSPEVLILSGYEDFKYAKSAISLGVREYLLKPVKKQEFVSIVSECIERIQHKRQHRNQEASDYISIQRTRSILLQNLLLDLLCANNKKSAQDIITRLYGLGISLDKGLYRCAVLQIRLTDDNQDYISAAVKNISDEVLVELKIHNVVTTDFGHGMLIFLYHEQQQDQLLKKVKTHLTHTIQLIKSHLRAVICVGVGAAVYSGEALSESYDTAKRALLCKIFDRQKSIHVYDRLAQGTSLPLPDISGIFEKDHLSASMRMNRLFDRILAQGLSQAALADLQALHLNLIRTAHRQLITAGEEYSPDFASLDLIWDSLHLHRKTAAYLQWLETQLNVREKGESNTLYVDILRYVRNNAAKSINLNTVAIKFNRSPGHLCALFKKEGGMTFTELLTSERMKLAKEMLENTSTPIHEISTLCGYTSVKYFASVFKRNVGNSPSAYREHYKIENQLF